MHRFKVALTLLTASLATPTDAYLIAPAKPIHEKITELALLCSAADLPRPLGCLPYYPDIEAPLINRRPNGIIAAARWPDDPLRQLSSTAIPGWPVSVLYTCQASRAARRHAPVQVRGLLCSSHYGKLQFFHGMASSAEEAKNPDLTNQKMRDWANFTYRVAIGDIKSNAPYCSTVRDLRNSISEDLAPIGFPFCNDWTMATLFSLKCWAPGGRLCFQSTGEVGDRHTRKTAIGALSHMIEDSYAQGHAARGAQNLALTGRARVGCAYPTAFYLYASQNHSQHRRRDNVPALGNTCISGASADDVITAVATVLWHYAHGSDPKLVDAYLKSRVIG